jgi:hypothetical protein
MFDVIMLSAVHGGNKGLRKKGRDVECFGNFKEGEGQKEKNKDEDNERFLGLQRDRRGVVGG